MAQVQKNPRKTQHCQLLLLADSVSILVASTIVIFRCYHSLASLGSNIDETSGPSRSQLVFQLHGLAAPEYLVSPARLSPLCFCVCSFLSYKTLARKLGAQPVTSLSCGICNHFSKEGYVLRFSANRNFGEHYS